MKFLTLRQTMVFAAAGSLAVSALARPRHREVNVREQCRSDLAGIYLTVHDQAEQAAQFAMTLERKLTELEKARRETASTLAKLKEQAERRDFDAALAEKIASKEQRLGILERYVDDYQDKSKKARATSGKARREAERLKASLKTVFRFAKVRDDDEAGYPFRLVYKDSCPKYRHLCPLPAQRAEALLTILDDRTVPTACRRYASYAEL